MIRYLRWVLVLAIFYSFVKLFELIEISRLIKVGAYRFYMKIREDDIKRLDKEKKERILYGYPDDRGGIMAFERKLRYSGIFTVMPWLNTELVIVMVLFVNVIFLAVGIIAGGIALGTVLVIFLDFGLKLLLDRLIKVRYMEVEKELLNFINSVDNFCFTEDEPVTILQKSAAAIGGVLRHEIIFAVKEARKNGNANEAFMKLEDGISHPFFKSFIRNLWIASQNSANYKDVIAESRNMLMEYLDNTEKLDAIYTKAKKDIALVLAGSFVSLFMLIRIFLGVDFGYAWVLMTSSFLGMAVLVFSLFSVAFTLYYIFESGKGVGI